MPSTTKTVLITGASSGIGAAAGHVFAAAGYNVILAARRKDRLEALASELRATATGRIVAHECDVNSDASVAQLFQALAQEFPALDVLVNNAGYGLYGAVADTPVADFAKNMDTNYLGVIRCIQGALPLLRRAAAANPSARWGASIVNVSSIVGRRAMPKLASYCASKFALEALSESLRVELWDDRIAVSVVNPGVTRTEFGAAARGNRPAGFLSFKDGMDPLAVARIIRNSAERPARNRYLTLSGKACVWVESFAPKLLDRILLRIWRNTNRKGNVSP